MRIRHWTVAVFATLVAAALTGAAAGAGGQSAEHTDPAGDIPKNAPTWQDVLSNQVVLQGNTFTFSMNVAEALPKDPPAASGSLGWYMWGWGINSDPDLSPPGWPFSPNEQGPHEFFVFLVSDGEQYFAFVADRRPLADGEDVIITPVPFRVRGSSIQVFVDAGLLDDPTDFLWSFGSITWHGNFEGESYDVVDTGVPHFVPWPQN